MIQDELWCKLLASANQLIIPIGRKKIKSNKLKTNVAVGKREKTVQCEINGVADHHIQSTT